MQKPQYAIQSFVEKYSDQDWKSYEVSGPCVIFGKTLHCEPDGESFIVAIHNGLALENCLPQISGYINWLGFECKNDLIAFYNAHVAAGNSARADDAWYEALEIYGVKIYVDKDAKLSADIAFGDTHFPDHILDVSVNEHQFCGDIGLDG
ncbi:MAG: hypothetical protein LBV79_02960 [Candidatus Adiutrix sp.]|jgi:hypothetical protein|nr:hypothetical protein [Candidatus Adiutrix sp.]